MIKPYWYQLDCLKALQRARERSKNKALIVLASGLGKTVTVVWDALEFIKDKPDARVLFMAHQMDILHQAKTTFEVIHGSPLPCDFMFTKHKPVGKPRFLFAMLQSMRKACRDFAPDDFDYVIVDESHHTYAETFLDVVQYWKPKFLLGMTATPDRTDGQDICQVFGQPVFYLPIEEALAQDLLTSVDYRVITDEIQFPKSSELLKRRWSINELNRRIFVPKRDQEIARIIEKNIRGIEKPQMIVFCQSVAYCDHLAKFLPNSLPFHWKVPAEERILRLEMFRTGLIPTLLTVDVFNEGVDVPHANVLVFLRSTSSPVVFLQQLGRGLRISEEKKRVVVLDFVANCERIKTIYELWSQVRNRREAFLKSKSALIPRHSKNLVNKQIEPITVDGGHIEFQEKVMHLMDIVRRITDGYSREEAISLLKGFAKKLERSPTQREVQDNREMPSISFLQKTFGTFEETLTAAGLVPNQFKNVSKGQLLVQLKTLAEELEHPPTQDEVAVASTAGKCSSEPVFRKNFGSLNNALEEIGLKPDRKVGFTKTELCEQLRMLHKKLGRLPGTDDLITSSAQGETASYTVFRKHFKTWQRALKASDLIVKAEPIRRYDGAELIEDLMVAKAVLGKVPSAGDITRLQKEGVLNTKSLTPFYTAFGNFPNALKMAGIK